MSDDPFYADALRFTLQNALNELSEEETEKLISEAKSALDNRTNVALDMLIVMFLRGHVKLEDYFTVHVIVKPKPEKYIIPGNVRFDGKNFGAIRSVENDKPKTKAEWLEHYRRWEQGQVIDHEYGGWKSKENKHMDLTFDEYIGMECPDD